MLSASDDDVVLTSPVGALRDTLPLNDVWRTILATDALASVDGFRTMVLLTHEHLFGMRLRPGQRQHAMPR